MLPIPLPQAHHLLEPLRQEAAPYAAIPLLVIDAAGQHLCMFWTMQCILLTCCCFTSVSAANSQACLNGHTSKIGAEDLAVALPVKFAFIEGAVQASVLEAWGPLISCSSGSS